MTIVLEESIVFQIGKSVTVLAELASILQSTRFSRHFQFEAPQANLAVEQVNIQKNSGFKNIAK